MPRPLASVEPVCHSTRVSSGSARCADSTSRRNPKSPFPPTVTTARVIGRSPARSTLKPSNTERAYRHRPEARDGYCT